jgi:hypothetical protein
VTTIDLGEAGREEWDPGLLGLAPQADSLRRRLLVGILVVAVLIGAAGAAPPAHGIRASALAELAEVERVDIDGDVAVGVLPDSGEVVAVSLATGALLWRRDPGFNGLPTVQLSGDLVILDTSPGSPHKVSIVDAHSGRPLYQADGSTVAPSVRGFQAVRRFDGTRTTVTGIGPTGGWVAAWPSDASPIPVYAQGWPEPAVVAMEPDRRVRSLDLVSGVWTELGRVEFGDIPLGLFDGHLQVRQDRRGADYIALYDTGSGSGPLRELWRDRISGSDPPRLIPCGAYLCGGFGNTTAYDLRDGHIAWSAGWFRITATVPGAHGEPLMAGVVTDGLRRSQEALLDPVNGRILAMLGSWRLGLVAGGTAYVYRTGIAGRAWFGTVDLRRPQAGVRTTLHLPVPAQHCDFSEQWAVCLTGVADQPPYAIRLSP